MKHENQVILLMITDFGIIWHYISVNKWHYIPVKNWHYTMVLYSCKKIVCIV